MENNFFPVFLNMQNKKVLIIGAGKIAFRKAETLLSYGAKIKVIAKDIKEEKFKELENIELSLEDFALMNEVYNEYLGNIKPARACVEVARLPKDVKVEIEVIAVK